MADAKIKNTARVCTRLNLGLAFGTGEHPTTSLWLEWLDGHISPDMQVLDYGCGSGILAISSLRLGAHSAWAVDIEPQALVATRENACLNKVKDKIWTGLPKDLPEYIEVDMLEVELGESVHLSDITLPEGVISVALSIGEKNDLSVAIVQAPRGIAEDEEDISGEEGAEEQTSSEESTDDQTSGEDESK